MFFPFLVYFSYEALGVCTLFFLLVLKQTIFFHMLSHKP